MEAAYANGKLHVTPNFHSCSPSSRTDTEVRFTMRSATHAKKSSAVPILTCSGMVHLSSFSTVASLSRRRTSATRILVPPKSTATYCPLSRPDGRVVICDGSICAEELEAALTYDLWSAAERDRSRCVDSGERNCWFTLLRKDCARDERDMSIVSESVLVANGLISRGKGVDVVGDNGVAVDG